MARTCQEFGLSRVARAVSLFKHHQISANTALNSVFGEDGYMADEAEMGLIRLIPTYSLNLLRGENTP